MKKYSYLPPKIISSLFKDFYWKTTNGKILLTFDDGPIPESTNSLINLLDKFNLKAMFFCVGENIKKYPAIAKELIEEGHTIANHTFNHKILTKISRDETFHQIKALQDIAEEKLNYEINYFRPPHGRFKLSTNSILKKLKLKNVMWSLLSGDFTGEKNFVKKGIEKYLTKNSIVVFHDNLKSKDILDYSIKYLMETAAKNNFEIGEPEECLK